MKLVKQSHKQYENSSGNSSGSNDKDNRTNIRYDTLYQCGVHAAVQFQCCPTNTTMRMVFSMVQVLRTLVCFSVLLCVSFIIFGSNTVSH